MQRIPVLLLVLLATVPAAQAQIEVRTEAQLTTSGGEHTPLWLNANKQGLSSLDKTNAYLRAGAFRPLESDSNRLWKRGFGVDMALATGFTSTVVAQQVYGELGWHHGLLTIGAKEQTLELKNPQLSTGAQTLGINARPVPGIRLSLPDYWTIPGTGRWLSLKGHIFYGWTTDDGWQRQFTAKQSKYTQHTMLHTKAGYLKIQKPQSPLSVELGLEMGCQFAGDTYWQTDATSPVIHNEKGLKGAFHAFVPGGGESVEDDLYKNKAGNHVGSYLVRIGYDQPAWSLSLYADHFFDDLSQMSLLSYDGYGTGDEWNTRKHFNWMVYDLRDMQLGIDLGLKHVGWIDHLVAEYIYTKYQSGPVFHDHTRILSDHLAGQDNYYNNYIYTGWQHWGQVMGNPLYLSPLYNSNGRINIADNRFQAWHLGLSGTPPVAPGLGYRLLATWQKGYGTYHEPFTDPRRNFSLLAEAHYTFADRSALRGWLVKGALALDRGSLLGNNTGVQLTVGKCLTINK